MESKLPFKWFSMAHQRKLDSPEGGRGREEYRYGAHAEHIQGDETLSKPPHMKENAGKKKKRANISIHTKRQLMFQILVQS